MRLDLEIYRLARINLDRYRLPDLLGLPRRHQRAYLIAGILVDISAFGLVLRERVFGAPEQIERTGCEEPDAWSG
jgi:hypothetical protein